MKKLPEACREHTRNQRDDDTDGHTDSVPVAQSPDYTTTTVTNLSIGVPINVFLRRFQQRNARGCRE